MRKIKVAILFGGVSTEHEVSCRSAYFVIDGIDKQKYDPILFGITKDGTWREYIGCIDNIKAGTWLEYTRNEKIPFKAFEFISRINDIDIVFPVLHGKNGEDGTIQGFLQTLDIPYTGCGILASSVCMDKSIAKAVFESTGIPQGKYITILKDDADNHLSEMLLMCEQKIHYPCFVKPSNAGSSVGVSKVYDREQLEKAIFLALKYDGRILVEEYMRGTEIECSIMGNEQPVASGTGKIIAAGDFYDYNAKYINNNSKVIIPAGLDDELENTVRHYALAAYKATDCSGLARVDFFVDEIERKVYINEINTMPGCTEISMYPKLWDKEGITGTGLITLLIEFGFERYRYNKSFQTNI